MGKQRACQNIVHQTARRFFVEIEVTTCIPNQFHFALNQRASNVRVDGAARTDSSFRLHPCSSRSRRSGRTSCRAFVILLFTTGKTSGSRSGRMSLQIQFGQLYSGCPTVRNVWNSATASRRTWALTFSGLLSVPHQVVLNLSSLAQYSTARA